MIAAAALTRPCYCCYQLFTPKRPYHRLCWPGFRRSAPALALTKRRVIHLYTTHRLTLTQTQRIFDRWPWLRSA